MTQVLRQLLSEHWQFAACAPDVHDDDAFTQTTDWLPASVPGTVQQDLMAAGRLRDPFVGLQEQEAQWIGRSDWLYRCQFDLPPHFTEAPYLDLRLDGLDTIATVWFNQHVIATSTNMFVPLRVPIHHLVRVQGNELRIRFRSSLIVGKEYEAREGQRAVWMGDPSRVYVRKAQYHYGWDWGPTLLTAGPWRDIVLEAYTARITEVWCPIELAEDRQSATIAAQVLLTGADQLHDASLIYRLTDPAGQEIAQRHLPLQGGEGADTVQFIISQPQLWWPHGYGDQPRYHLHLTLIAGGHIIDQMEQRLGIRTIQLQQEPQREADGTSFGFVVNGVSIFCGGANWIPADSFLPRITSQRYRDLLTLAADAHLTMLRVWGGGIYEPDDFYETCDELGILVWQDFMFACGIYPASEAFQASVQAEATASIKRLRHHPSLALWCGNNEDYLLAEEQGSYSLGSDLTTPIAAAFPARVIYEQLLPTVCARLDPARPYWPGSPYGGTTVNDALHGDQHVWNVWHGTMADYHTYPQLVGRFISEFGMQAFPSLATIAAFTASHERLPHSQVVEAHNKLADGPRRLAVYVNDTVPTPESLDAYAYATQLVQAEALATAFRGWRRQWQGSAGRWAGGALVWQFNDCWPGISWSIIDYFGRPKPAYYALRRELAPITIGLASTEAGMVNGWVINMTPHLLHATFHLHRWDMSGAHVGVEQRAVTLAPYSSQELPPFPYGPSPDHIISAQLVRENDVLARAALWPEPLKYHAFPDPGVTLTWQDAQTIQIVVQHPAKGVWLSITGDERWSDNMLDLFPHDTRIITLAGTDAPHALRLQRVGHMRVHEARYFSPFRAAGQ